MSIYDFKVNDIRGREQSLSQYKGKVLIVVNTASKCGFTPQYSDLQKLYEQYQEKGLEILAFPSNQFGEQEPGSNSDVQSFCQMNYGVTFPLFEKGDVRGPEAHDVFKYLVQEAPFKGFNVEEPSGKMLNTFLTTELPHYLMGDDIKWNFTKFLIDRDGQVVARYESTVDPMDLAPAVEQLL